MILAVSQFVINWASLVSLLIGLILGAVLFVLFYALITIKHLKKTDYTFKDEIKDVKEDEIKKIIQESKDRVENYKKENNEISVDFVKKVVYEEMNSIAGKFYPESKHPLQELTVEEMVLLNHYILSKIEKIFDQVLLRPIKKSLKVRQIIALFNVKRKIDNTKVVKTIKKYKLNLISKTVMTAINIFNPRIWFTRLVYNPTMNHIIKEITMTIIDVVGIETYHVYSKQAFMQDVEDKEIDNLINIMNEESLNQNPDQEEIKEIETKK